MLHMLDPEILRVWEHVRDHAEQLRQQVVRVSWKDQVASSERLDSSLLLFVFSLTERKNEQQMERLCP